MSDTSFSLPDRDSLDDLRTYLGRAARVENGSVRVVADAGVLAVYTAVLYPIGLLDEVPTVLGLRTFALTEPEQFDVVVPIASFSERLTVLADALPDATDGAATDPIVCTLPHEVNTVTWAAITPPRGGWRALGEMRGELLTNAARDGVTEVADAVPGGAGEAIVRRVRAEVWGKPIDGVDFVPGGAGFAMDSLGFIVPGEGVRLFEAGPWYRLSTSRGHVLVKQRVWWTSL